MVNKQENKNIDNIFTGKFILSSIIVGFLFFLYTDYWGFSRFGFFLSLGLFLLAILVSLKNYSKGLSIAVITVFLSARVPRNLVLIISDLRIENEMEFHSLIHSSFAGFSFAQWIFLFMGFIAVVKYFKTSGGLIVYKNIKTIFIMIAIVMGAVYLGTLLDVFLFRDIFNLRKFISDHKLFIILITSLIVGNYYIKIEKEPIYKFARNIIFISLASGFKTICFFLNDITNKIPTKEFSTESYLILPLFFAIIYYFSKKVSYLKLVLLSLVVFMGGFSIQRGDIMFFVIDLFVFIYLIVSSLRESNLTVKRSTIISIILIIIILIPPIILYNFHRTAYLLWEYKIDFFTEELASGKISESPKIRIYEFKNIFKEGVDLVYPLLIGKGFGGYFTYKNFPADFEFGLFDYTKEELRNRKYFNPHTFINFYLLKGGLILLLFYIFLIIYMFFLGMNSLNAKRNSAKFIAIFTCFYFIFAFNMFWRPIYIFLFGILINILLKIQNEETTALEKP